MILHVLVGLVTKCSAVLDADLMDASHSLGHLSENTFLTLSGIISVR